jgi:hypothetical protein
MRRVPIFVSALTAFGLVATWTRRCVILLRVVRGGLDPILSAGESGEAPKEGLPGLQHDDTASRPTPKPERDKGEASESASGRAESQISIPRPRESDRHHRDHALPQAHMREADAKSWRASRHVP